MPEETKDLHFPKAGMDRSLGFGAQPNRPAAFGEYARTTYLARNVRAFEPGSSRTRGGSRMGLAKWINARVAGTVWVIQELAVLSSTAYPTPGAAVVQPSQSGRVVTLVAVSQGSVFAAGPTDTTWTAATNATGETPALNITGVMFSAVNNQLLFFADGINYAYYNPQTNTVYPWVATKGELPVDSENNTPRLICTWRGRTVLSGILKDPTNLFMSRISDPFDWLYLVAGTDFDSASPWAGSQAPQGQLGDVVTCLIPYSDDVLIIGCDHTIYMFRGDPNNGGQIDLITSSIGMAFGMPWCQDPEGTIWFFSNRTGIFTLVPGQQPVRVSQQIESLLQPINTGENSIRLLWDDRFQGLHVFITSLIEPGATTHYFYEKRAGAWWQDTFANHNHDPLTCCTLDGNEPDDRVPLIGCWDGYVRFVSTEADDDDGTPIESEVWIGPLLTQGMDELMLKELQGMLGAAAEDVNYEIYTGDTSEEALSSTPFSSGTLSAGRNVTDPHRASGHSIYVRLFSERPWSMEQIRVTLRGHGKVRRRN